jgi:cyclic pyranopterin phosphate synthase
MKNNRSFILNLSHLDKTGQARMVDVSRKKNVKRTAVAHGTIVLAPATVRLLKNNLLKKGDALACARVAGIMAAKKTSELIPLCHGIAVDHVSIDFEVGKAGIGITATAACVDKTGIEMEALTAVAIAALTIYDMCKAVDKNMSIGEVRLIEKRKEPMNAEL